MSDETGSRVWAVRYMTPAGWRYYDGRSDVSDPRQAQHLDEQGVLNVIRNIFVIEGRVGVAVPFSGPLGVEEEP